MSSYPAVDADPVLGLLTGRRADPRALYYLWEQQQWEAGRVDLALDAQQWDGVDPSLRRSVADAIAWRRLRAQNATTALVRFVDVAPNEEQQVFLTTHLVDEVRHLVFFDRVQTEVMGARGEAMEERAGLVDDVALRSLLVDELARACRGPRSEGAGPAELVDAVTGFHVVVLGALGLTEQKALDDWLSEEKILPGIRRGLELETRSAHRQVAFGLGFVADAVSRDPSLEETVVAAVVRSLPLVRSRLAAAATVAPTPYPGAQLIETADAAVERWLAAVGVRVPLPS